MDRPPPGQVLPRCCVGTLRGRPGAPRTDHACQLPIRLGHPCGSSPSSAPGPSTALVTATSPGGFTPCRHTATSPTASDTPIGCCHCCWTSRSGTGAYTGMTRRTSICRGCLRQVHDLAKALDAWPAGENERRRAAYDAHMDLRGRASSKVTSNGDKLERKPILSLLPVRPGYGATPSWYSHTAVFDGRSSQHCASLTWTWLPAGCRLSSV